MTALQADVGNRVDVMLMWAAMLQTRRRPVPANAYVRAGIDPVIRNEAATVPGKMGLTVSDLCRMALTRVALEKRLPFSDDIPNALTRETMANVLRGEELHQAEDLDDLLLQLENCMRPPEHPSQCKRDAGHRACPGAAQKS